MGGGEWDPAPTAHGARRSNAAPRFFRWWGLLLLLLHLVEARLELIDGLLLFLHDLTRRGEPEYEAGDAAIAARLPTALIEANRLVPVFNKADAAAARISTSIIHISLR